ncbi:hypothetical protein EB118_12665 [bacterium]|nr:hypothetical protein [bacterium]NDC94787.1 hypothetical protein [bacterium]NDD84546.1 hypothetical protein [bacterium]NDG30912.1 hypothetical protein [bacterium]
MVLKWTLEVTTRKLPKKEKEWVINMESLSARFLINFEVLNLDGTLEGVLAYLGFKLKSVRAKLVKAVNSRETKRYIRSESFRFTNVFELLPDVLDMDFVILQDDTVTVSHVRPGYNFVILYVKGNWEFTGLLSVDGKTVFTPQDVHVLMPLFDLSELLTRHIRKACTNGTCTRLTLNSIVDRVQKAIQVPFTQLQTESLVKLINVYISTERLLK